MCSLESENDKPWEVLKDKSQLYMILVMENCGTDLDAAKLSAKEAVHLIKGNIYKKFLAHFNSRYLRNNLKSREGDRIRTSRPAHWQHFSAENRRETRANGHRFHSFEGETSYPWPYFR